MNTFLQENNEIYDNYYTDIIKIENLALSELRMISNDKITHLYSRIKSTNSVIAKLKKRDLPVEPSIIFTHISDIIGIRIIVKFIDDVYNIADEIKMSQKFDIINCKDYINEPKKNGYRSYHIITKLVNYNNIPLEIQIRTISQDAWASLEHTMKYKRIVRHQELIKNELRLCADEMASIDISMQTIKELIDDNSF